MVQTNARLIPYATATFQEVDARLEALNAATTDLCDVPVPSVGR